MANEKEELQNHIQNLRGVESRDVESLSYISGIKEIMELSEFLNDDSFDEILNLSVRCFMEPTIRQDTAKTLLVKFQAASIKFGTLAVYYMTLRKGKAGTEDNYKKNIYYSLSDLCDKMAQSLKYIARREQL